LATRAQQRERRRQKNARFPDAVQREAVHRRSGIALDSASVTIPGQQRTTALRSVLRYARETNA
jgi:hypothetical protein